MKFAKKSLGQNFLIDVNVIKKIINLSDVKNRNVIEIGPGYGALTNEILKQKPKTFSIIEKDHKLFTNLKSSLKNKKNINIFNEDILKFKLENILKTKTIIFGNLPYNISSQILIKIIKYKLFDTKVEDMILMFQKELAKKLYVNIPQNIMADYQFFAIIN